MYNSLHLVAQASSNLTKYGYSVKSVCGGKYPCIEFAPSTTSAHPELNLIYVVKFCTYDSRVEEEVREWHTGMFTCEFPSMEQALEFVASSVSKAHARTDADVKCVSSYSETYHYIQVECQGERRWFRKLGDSPNEGVYWKTLRNGEDWEDAVLNMSDVGLVAAVCDMYSKLK